MGITMPEHIARGTDGGWSQKNIDWRLREDAVSASLEQDGATTWLVEAPV